MEMAGWGLGGTEAMLGGFMPTLLDKNSISREALDAFALTVYTLCSSSTLSWAELSHG